MTPPDPDPDPVPDPGPDPDPEPDPGVEPDPGPDEICEKICDLAIEACEPVADLCERQCVPSGWDEDVAICMSEAGGCREAFGCINDDGPLPGPDPDPGPGPPPGADCRQTCEEVGDACDDEDLADRCMERCGQPGAGFPQACVDEAGESCDDIGSCFGSEPDVCEDVCPIAEAACPGLLEDCAEACSGLPGPATECMAAAETCDDVIGCVLDQVSDCQTTCGRISDLCRDDLGDCVERCEAGDLDVDERICANNARQCEQFRQCVEFVEAACIGACNNVERVCPGQDDTCNFDCGVWEEETIDCVSAAASCGAYNLCIDDEEGREGGGPPDLPGGDDADEVCIGVCTGLIPEEVCPDQNALCQRGCRAIEAEAWGCVAAAMGRDDRCDAVQECIGEAAEEGVAHSRRCDSVCDEVRRSCQGPIAFFCEDTCRALRPNDDEDSERIECLDHVMEDGFNGRECNALAECLDLGFLGGGGRGGGRGGP